MPEGGAAIQGDLARLEKWAERNLTKFSKEKWYVLPLGRSNPRHRYALGATRLEISLEQGPWGPGGHQGDHEPPTCPCCKEGERCPGLHSFNEGMGKVLPMGRNNPRLVGPAAGGTNWGGQEGPSDHQE
ncbi:hypothetical protein QYF61_011482 [Mycteria americana]|uniref:Rna-directed dna polymerase from mobile element jockey-like n=1 Tax=Mycteria americana TaxID=33587 RepID=A0AAN7MJH5_MYCAM|nr:hypothetical protein QYF61_011482 [Mycteria americana]